MQYTVENFTDKVARWGEVFVVLETGYEYEIHGTESYELTELAEGAEIRVEGMQGDEYVVVEFPLDAIEHFYTHKEV